MTSPISIMAVSSVWLRMVTCVRITSTIEHHTVFRDRNGGITDCGRRHDGTRVRFQSFWKHRSAEKPFDRLRAWQIAVWLNRLRGILLPASFVHLFFTIHVRSLLLSLHSSQSSPSPPWLARCLYPSDLVRSETRQRLFLPFSPTLRYLSQPHRQ